jgi:hypothetical protein
MEVEYGICISDCIAMAPPRQLHVVVDARLCAAQQSSGVLYDGAFKAVGSDRRPFALVLTDPGETPVCRLNARLNAGSDS